MAKKQKNYCVVLFDNAVPDFELSSNPGSGTVTRVFTFTPRPSIPTGLTST